MTGASGFIGSALTTALEARGDEVIPLRRGGSGPEPSWDIGGGRIDEGALAGMDAVVHLAGSPILPPWTAAKKRRILESRVQGTDLIARAVAAAGTRVLVTASGMDFYGDRGDTPVDETEPKGEGFMSDIVASWEGAAAPAVAAGARVVHMRSSLVLDGAGGSLPLMMLPFRFFVGGPIGGGEQWWSWITLEDEVRAVVHILDTEELRGPVNMASPEPVRNRHFMRGLGKAMRRPSWFPAPALLVKAALGSDAAEAMVLESKRLVPAVLTSTGFRFSHPDYDAAILHAVREGS